MVGCNFEDQGEVTVAKTEKFRSTLLYWSGYFLPRNQLNSACIFVKH